MKFFDRWFYRKARWCWHRAGVKYPELKAEQDALDEFAKRDKHQYTGEAIPTPVLRDDDDIELEKPIRFKVARAEGGMIVEVTDYDSKTDRRVTKHHIIPSETEDVAGAIAKIVTIEFLRR